MLESIKPENYRGNLDSVMYKKDIFEIPGTSTVDKA